MRDRKRRFSPRTSFSSSRSPPRGEMRDDARPPRTPPHGGRPRRRVPAGADGRAGVAPPSRGRQPRGARDGGPPPAGRAAGEAARGRGARARAAPGRPAPPARQRGGDRGGRAEAERDAILALQGRVAALLAQAEDALAALERWRRTAVGDLLVRDSPPIWSPELRARALARVPVRVRDVVGADAAELADFLASRPWRLAVQLAGLVALGLALRRGQARARRWMAQEESVVSVAAVFDPPSAPALLLAALASWWMSPGPPRLMGVVVPLLVVPPVLVISRHIVPAPVRPALYALGSFYVADRLRDFAAVVPLLERTLFLLEVAAGVIVAGWLLASGRLARPPRPGRPRAPTLPSTAHLAA